MIVPYKNIYKSKIYYLVNRRHVKRWRNECVYFTIEI